MEMTVLITGNGVKSIIDRFLASLHEARRQQAALTIQRYRHLMADDAAVDRLAKMATSPVTSDEAVHGAAFVARTSRA
jgi:hypothetical protein